MELQIRHEEPNDLEAIVKIYGAPQVIAGTLQVPFPSLEAWRKRLAGQSPDASTLVAVADGDVVGHLGIMPGSHPRRAHVASIAMAVRDDHCGRGIGTALLQTAISLADNWLNLQRLELTVFTDNAPAIRLYEKHGFVIEGTHRAFALRNGNFVDAYAMGRLYSGASPA
jgi:putative acetyltransferase